MSRIYWHTQHRTAELHGSEREWLADIARRPASAAWDLEPPGRIEQAVEICAMIPEAVDGQYGANYLHNDLRAAVEEDQRHRSAIRAGMYGTHDPEPMRKLLQSLRLRVTGRRPDAEFVVAGRCLQAANVSLNTALVAGSDPVRLAAKIDGWCEVHCWIDGSDRAWCADIIEQALTAGIFRRGLWYSGEPDGPRDRWSDQGWDDVLALLRERDDGPVVLSYSVCDEFPNPGIAEWPMRAQFPVPGMDWSELTPDEQWDHGMAALRRRPWGRIGPDTLAEVMFGEPVTVYDLLAPDRDERVRAAFELESSGAGG